MEHYLGSAEKQTESFLSDGEAEKSGGLHMGLVRKSDPETRSGRTHKKIGPEKGKGKNVRRLTYNLRVREEGPGRTRCRKRLKQREERE